MARPEITISVTEISICVTEISISEPETIARVSPIIVSGMEMSVSSPEMIMGVSPNNFRMGDFRALAIPFSWSGLLREVPRSASERLW